jgi:T-complex protein 1 subunit alpha
LLLVAVVTHTRACAALRSRVQFLAGQRESGDDVRIGNVTAAVAVANIVKTSLGPIGLDKILSLLELEHPAARLLVELAQLQDKEVGDGTTSVVLIAAELLRRGNDLVKLGIHPTTILAGYRMALREAVAYLKSAVVLSTAKLDATVLTQAAKTSMSSKLIGSEADFFAEMAVKAVQSVRTIKVAGSGGNNGNGAAPTATAATSEVRYPLSAIHVIKAHGQSSLESQILTGGFALATARASQGMPTRIDGAKGPGGSGSVKVCLLDMNLQRHRMAMGVQIQVTDPKEVERIKQREMDLTKEKVQLILRAGANVVLTTKGMDDLVLKYFVEAGVIACRRVPMGDMKRLAKATGGTVVVTLADMEGDESFDPAQLGTCGSVQEVRVSDGEMLHFYDCHGAGASTILLRGANSYQLDEMDRSLHDALCVVKRMLESPTLVPGGGAVEAALSVHLEGYAKTLDSREQYAVQEFASSLLVIPKQLAVNAAKDSSDLVAQLRAAHAKSQAKGATEADAALKYHGLDLVAGTVRNNLAAGVVEPAMSKIKSLRFATEAAITILRIDDRITVNPEPRQ